MQREELEALQVSFTLASQLTYGEPAEEAVRQYVDYDLFVEAPCGGDDPAVQRGLAELRAWCLETAPALGDAAAFAARMGDVRSDWLALLGGAGVPKAPSWAGYYLTPNSQVLSEETLAVRRLYARYGFSVVRKNSVPDDELAIMLGFIAYLMGVELQAGEGSELAAQAAADQRSLLVERILPWICTWHYDMQKHAKTAYYRGIGHYVLGLLRVYAARFGIVYNESGDPSFWMAAK